MSLLTPVDRVSLAFICIIGLGPFAGVYTRDGGLDLPILLLSLANAAFYAVLFLPAVRNWRRRLLLSQEGLTMEDAGRQEWGFLWSQVEKVLVPYTLTHPKVQFLAHDGSSLGEVILISGPKSLKKLIAEIPESAVVLRQTSRSRLRPWRVHATLAFVGCVLGTGCVTLAGAGLHWLGVSLFAWLSLGGLVPLGVGLLNAIVLIGYKQKVSQPEFVVFARPMDGSP